MLTSFAGIDISFGEGSPAFFETRVLDGIDELECLEFDVLGRSPRSAPGRDGTVALLGRRRPGCDVAGGRPSVSHRLFSATGRRWAAARHLGGWFIGIARYLRCKAVWGLCGSGMSPKNRAAAGKRAE